MDKLNGCIFLIKDNDLLEIYNTIWDKVSADLEPVYDKEYLKTKIKSNSDKVTNFFKRKIPKVDFNHTSLAAISLNFVLKKDENYYSRGILKECKYIEKKAIRHISDDFSDFSSDDDKSYKE